MKSRLFGLLVSVLAIFSMVLTACGDDAMVTPRPPAATETPTAVGTNTRVPADANVAPAATHTPAGAGAAATSVPAAPTSTPWPGEKVLRLNLMLGAEPATVDPQQASFVDEVEFVQMNFETLFTLDQQGRPVPAAAAKLDVSSDGTRYTVTLRDGLTYSDGTPLTAHNFEYAFRRELDPRLENRQYAGDYYAIKGAADLDTFTNLTDTAKLQALQAALGVQAPDDTHLQFTLTGPAAYFPYLLAIWPGSPVREDMVTRGGARWTAPATYVGNGPYVLKEWSNDSGSVWEANPHFRKGKPKIDRIELRAINDSAVAFQAYKDGDLDVDYVAAEDLETVKSDPLLRAQYLRVAGNCTYYLGFNVKKAPFDNLKVRKAFALAFDRQDWVDNIVKGQGQPALSFIPPNRPGYNPDIQQPPFAPAAAAQALADAGFPHGQGLPPITLTYRAGARNQVRFAWFQSQMKTHLGINAQLNPVEATAYSDLTKSPATTPQVFFLGWCQDYPDPQNWLTLVFRSDSTVSHLGWKNDQFDKLVTQADTEADQAKRLADYAAAQQILVDDVPVVFIYWDVTDYLIKPYVLNLKEQITPDDTIPGYKNIEHIDLAK